MRTLVLTWLAAGLLTALPATAQADQQSLMFGGDAYVAGQVASSTEPVTHDAFLAGNDVTISAPVEGDAHLAGYNVQSSGDVGGNLYAAGFSVTVSGTVGGDITAMGNTVTVRTSAPVSGNIRVAGASVTIDSVVNGSILVAGKTVTINAPVGGDVSFYGETLSFGPAAKIEGQVLIHSPAEIPVPATAAPPERVVFSQLTSPQYPSEVAQTAEVIAKSFWVTLWAAALWWLLLLVIGSAMISLNAPLVGKLQTLAAVKPFSRLGLGLLAFAAVIGLMPLAALTLVGILLLPIVLIFVVAACSAAYLAGVSLIGLAIASRMTSLATTLRKIAALAASLVVAGLLTMIPFVGWFVTLGFTVFGFGVIAALVMANWSGGDRERLAGLAPAGPALAKSS